MKLTSLKSWSLPIALCPVLTGCRAAKGDPMAEADPPVRVESEDLNVIQVDHPEQFPVVTVTEHISASKLTVIGVVNPAISETGPSISIGAPRVVQIRARLDDALRETQFSPRVRRPTPAHVWIVCEVNESDVAEIQIDETVQIRLNAYPDRVLIGRINSVGPVLGPMRAATVRIEVRNLGSMRAGMLATATFHAQGNEIHAAIPITAILHMHDRDWVYVPAGYRKFRRVDASS